MLRYLLLSIFIFSCSENPLFHSGNDLIIWTSSSNNQHFMVSYAKEFRYETYMSIKTTSSKKYKLQPGDRFGLAIDSSEQYFQVSLDVGDSIFVEYGNRFEVLHLGGDSKNFALFDIDYTY